GVLLGSAAGEGLAGWLGLRRSVALGAYESFLFLMGSVFVPLFGVFVADYFLLGRRGRFTDALCDPGPGRKSRPGLNAWAIAAWIFGFLIYQWSWTVPTGLHGWQSTMITLFHRWLHLSYPLAQSRWGASIPSFGAALLVYLVLVWLTESRRGRRTNLSR